jgi:hypothetical protein
MSTLYTSEVVSIGHGQDSVTKDEKRNETEHVRQRQKYRRNEKENVTRRQ